MYTVQNPNIPTKKSAEDIKFYKDNCPKFGEILWEIKAKLSNGWYKSGLELSEDFKQKAKNVFGHAVGFPFEYQANYLGTLFAQPICVSVDDCVAHGRHMGNFLEGDVVSVDFGLELNGLVFDSGFTTTYAKEDEDWIYSPLYTLKGLLLKPQPENTKQISAIIENGAEIHKTDIVIALTGHGIGRSLHEGPHIYNMEGAFVPVEFFDGMCVCVEPIFVKKEDSSLKPEIAKVYMGEDNWGIYTSNGQPATHWETMFCYENGELIDLVGITSWK